jgi:hypothetical protein
MTSSIDLNLLPLARQDGNDKTELPDMYAVTPPRRTAHGREEDSLIIYLSMTGNSPLSPEAHAQLLQQLAQKFYKTAGSLTSALRTVAESLNLYLLDRNLRSTSVGRQGIGQLILVALRSDTLYIAQCGIVHAFLITPKETQHLHDPQSSGRGLGLSRTTPMRFLQTKMEPDDLLVLTTQVSPGWVDNPLKHPQPQGIEVFRRQLLENGIQDFNAVILQAQAGTGKLKILKRKTESPDMAHPTTGAHPIETETFPQPSEDKNLGIPSSSPTPLTSNMGKVQTSSDGQQGAAPFPPQISTQPSTAYQSGSTQQDASGKAAGIWTDSTPKPTSEQAKAKTVHSSSRPLLFSRYFTSFRRTLAAVGAAILLALRNAMAALSRILLRLLKNLLPDADVLRLPPSAMVFIALAIPLILATIGGVVFLQRGRAQQHEALYKQAEEDAAYANTLSNPLEQHMAWQTVLGDLDKAEYYGVTSQSQALRATAIENLDNLDATKRLDYQQAIVGGLDPGVRVTQMVATGTELYLLNAEQGSV